MSVSSRWQSIPWLDCGNKHMQSFKPLFIEMGKMSMKHPMQLHYPNILYPRDDGANGEVPVTLNLSVVKIKFGNLEYDIFNSCLLVSCIVNFAAKWANCVRFDKYTVMQDRKGSYCELSIYKHPIVLYLDTYRLPRCLRPVADRSKVSQHRLVRIKLLQLKEAQRRFTF